MLVLTRHVNETILIGDLVEIWPVKVCEHGARLAIRFLKTETPVLKVAFDRDQPVEIGDGITIVAVSCSWDRMRIGITAPSDVPIARGEGLDPCGQPE